MASSGIDLKWEWPAGRTIETGVLVLVERVRPAPKGLFGMRASPSMADALPDAMDVTVVVDEQSGVHAGRTVKVRLPGVEAQKLVPGGRAALGLIESGRVCACVQAAPAATIEELRRWISGWKCPD